jgi:ATP-dependent Clp protease adaptor protein ClpS
MGAHKTDSETSTTTRERTRTKKPRLFKVVLINDDYTPMDFVVSILETIFRKTPAEAVQIMLRVHHTGKAVCGVYSKQIAEAKVALVRQRAQEEGHPLLCLLEEA